MAITENITAMPTPALSRTGMTDEEFIVAADADVVARGNLVTELNAFATQANSTAAAMNLNSTTDTSATSNSIATGAKTFTVTAGKSFQPGMWLVIADTAAPSTNQMLGSITSYSTDQLVMNITSIIGSGTKTAWTISQSAASATSATYISNTPAGSIASTTVQAAINELDTEKAALAGSASQAFSVANLTASSLNGGAFAFRNTIINGGFTINQRAYVSAATLAAGSYGHDRWKAGASGGDYSFTQLASNTTITIASGKSLIQVVEDKNVSETAYVLSWTGTAQARYAVNSATPSGSYAASPILITGQTAGTVMSIEFNTGTLGKVQLEAGQVATPFETLDVGTVLQKCQRYYERSYALTGLVASRVLIAFGISGAQGFYFTVPKRATPVVTIYSRNGNAGKVSNIATGSDSAGTTTAGSISTYGVHYLSENASGLTVGDAYEANYEASAEL